MAKLKASDFLGGGTPQIQSSINPSIDLNTYQPSAAEEAIKKTKEDLSMTREQHNSRLRQLLQEQATGQQKAKSTLDLIPGEFAKVGGLAWEGFTRLPPIKAASILTGAVVGAAGAVEGGVIGGALGVAKGLQEGKSGWGVAQSGLDEALHIGSETAKFGYNIGEKAAPIAISGLGGKIVRGALSATQIASGINSASEGFDLAKQGDTTGSITKMGEAGLNIGFGAMGLTGAMQNKDWLVSDEVKAYAKYLGSDERKLQKATEAMDKLVGSTSAVKKSDTKGLAKGMATGEEQPKVGALLAHEGIAPDIVKVGGKKVFSTMDPGGAVEQARAGADFVDDTLQNAMERVHPEPRHNLLDIKEAAVAKATEQFGTSKAGQLVADQIDDEIQRLGGKTVVSSSELNQIKRDFYKQGYDAVTFKSNPYATAGSYLSDELEKAFKGELDVHSINQVLGSYSEAAKVLTKLHGAPVPLGGDRLAVTAAKLMAGYAGHSTGIPLVGTILGYSTASMIEDLMASPDPHLNAIGAWMKTNPISMSQQIANQTDEAVAAVEHQREMTPKLTAGKPPGSPENPIIGSQTGATPQQPATGGLATQPPPDMSGPITPSNIAQPPQQGAEMNTILQRTGVTQDFPPESSHLLKTGEGRFWIMREGTAPVKLTPFEALILEQFGYKFLAPPGK